MKTTSFCALALIALFCQTSVAQTTPVAPPDAPPGAARLAEQPTATEGLNDLDALTRSCPRAALNAAAREVRKVHSNGNYQFSFFNIISESHHAQYEVHFRSNYAGEEELKYCVVLYCQQGWDPAQVQTTVTLLSAAPKMCSPMGSMPAAQHRHSAKP